MNYALQKIKKHIWSLEIAAKRSFQLSLLGLHQQMGIAQLITTEPSQRKLSKLREMYSRKPWKWPCPKNFFLANYKLMLHWFSLFVPSGSLPFERVGHPPCLQYLRCSLRYSIKYWVSSALTCKNIRCSMSFWSLLCHRAEIISQLMGEIKLLKSENFMLFLVFFRDQKLYTVWFDYFELTNMVV